MENASKAIIIAGGILISVVILSVLVILFNQIGSTYSAENDSLTIEQMEEYNRRFSVYNNVKGFYGSEILSLANLIEDYNNRLLLDTDGINSEYYTENSIKVEIRFVKQVIGITSGGVSIANFPSNINKELDISEIKAYNDMIEQYANEHPNNDDISGQLKDFRGLVFKCDQDRTRYNSQGRISYMHFTQQSL